MKKYLLLSAVAAFAATPAFAQMSNSPAAAPTGNEKAQHENVIEGAKESSQPGMAAPASGDVSSPAKDKTGNDASARKDAIEGAKDTEGRASTGSDANPTKPGIEAPGGVKREENRLPQ